MKREDEALTRVKLGLEPYKDAKLMLQEAREGEKASKRALNRLTEYEMRELTAKGGPLHRQNQGFENGAAAEEMTDQRETADRVGGLGTQRRDFAPSRGPDGKDLAKLEGEGLDDLKYLDQRKKLVLLNYLRDKVDTLKKEKKKDKKNKHKKNKEKKKKKSYSSDDEGNEKRRKSRSRRRHSPERRTLKRDEEERGRERKRRSPSESAESSSSFLSD